jgi:hypothetical protein
MLVMAVIIDSPEMLREKCAEVIKLAATMRDERAKLGLLDYAQQLLDQARDLERNAADSTTGITGLDRNDSC